jgi:hypothetical protein
MAKKQRDLSGCNCECANHSEFVDAFGFHRFYCASKEQEIINGIDIANDNPMAMLLPKAFPDWCPLEEVEQCLNP